MRSTTAALAAVFPAVPDIRNTRRIRFVINNGRLVFSRSGGRP